MRAALGSRAENSDQPCGAASRGHRAQALLATSGCKIKVLFLCGSWTFSGSSLELSSRVATEEKDKCLNGLSGFQLACKCSFFTDSVPVPDHLPPNRHEIMAACHCNALAQDSPLALLAAHHLAQPC